MEFLLRNILKKLELINLEFIKETTWGKAIELTENVDEFDAPLWTGDKKLITGLGKKGIDWILSTDVISKIRAES